MSENEAKQQLKKLRKERCTCGCRERLVCPHEAGCPYRIAAFLRLDLREFIGPLYAA